MAPPLIPLLAVCVWAGAATAAGLGGVAGAAAGLGDVAGVAAGMAAGLGLLGLDAAAVGLSGAVGCWRTLKGEMMPAGAQRWLAVVTLCLSGSNGCYVWLDSVLQVHERGLLCHGATDPAPERSEGRAPCVSDGQSSRLMPLGYILEVHRVLGKWQSRSWRQGS